MATKNFPGPNINRLIVEDPQIIKVPGASAESSGFQWGSRPSAMPKDVSAPMMGIKHVGNESK